MTTTTSNYEHLLNHLQKYMNLTLPTHSSLSKEDRLKQIVELTATPLTVLEKEPKRLEEEMNRIRTQLSHLAFSEYKSFLRAHASTQNIRLDLNKIHHQAERLDEQFEHLKLKLKELSCKDYEKYMTDRDVVGRIVQEQEPILDVLEIPLVNTFYF
jgi:hypothetical protein